MRRIVARKPARHVPSERECGWCEISSEDCSERIEPEGGVAATMTPVGEQHNYDPDFTGLGHVTTQL